VGFSLTKGLASEFTEKKIRASAVVPSFVQTELCNKPGETKEEQKMGRN